MPIVSSAGHTTHTHTHTHTLHRRLSLIAGRLCSLITRHHSFRVQHAARDRVPVKLQTLNCKHSLPFLQATKSAADLKKASLFFRSLCRLLFNALFNPFYKAFLGLSFRSFPFPESFLTFDLFLALLLHGSLYFSLPPIYPRRYQLFPLCIPICQPVYSSDSSH